MICYFLDIYKVEQFKQCEVSLEYIKNYEGGFVWNGW